MNFDVHNFLNTDLNSLLVKVHYVIGGVVIGQSYSFKVIEYEPFSLCEICNW